MHLHAQHRIDRRNKHVVVPSLRIEEHAMRCAVSIEQRDAAAKQEEQERAAVRIQARARGNAARPGRTGRSERAAGSLADDGVPASEPAVRPAVGPGAGVLGSAAPVRPGPGGASSAEIASGVSSAVAGMLPGVMAALEELGPV